jgi:hypothetical protein
MEVAATTLAMTQQSNAKTENLVKSAYGVGNTLGTSALKSGTTKRLGITKSEGPRSITACASATSNRSEPLEPSSTHS